MSHHKPSRQDVGGSSLVPYAAQEKGLRKLDLFESYIARIKHIKHLEADEEYDLAIRYKENEDYEAATRIIEAHLMLVVKIAYSFNYAAHNVMDLIQEGNIGLAEALKKYDPYRGVRFSSYSSWWIRAYIIKYLMDNWKMVRIGTTNDRRKLLYNLKKEKEELEALGIEAHPKLLAERLNVEEKDIIEVGEALDSPDVSLDAPLKEDENSASGIELLADNSESHVEEVEREMLIQFIRSKISLLRANLSEKELYILDNRLLNDEPQTLQEIGEKFSVSKEAIRLNEASLMKKIRKLFKRFPDMQGL